MAVERTGCIEFPQSYRGVVQFLRAITEFVISISGR